LCLGAGVGESKRDCDEVTAVGVLRNCYDLSSHALRGDSRLIVCSLPGCPVEHEALSICEPRRAGLAACATGGLPRFGGVFW
jgi:hypothetical protein